MSKGVLTFHQIPSPCLLLLHCPCHCCYSPYPVMRSFRPRKRQRERRSVDVDALVRDARKSATARAEGYREQSLAIYGWICAKCAREFDVSNLHLLTVHHKDGNHRNNPPDGSNWENLCVHCHDDEHSREIFADYLSGQDK